MCQYYLLSIRILLKKGKRENEEKESMRVRVLVRVLLE